MRGGEAGCAEILAQSRGDAGESGISMRPETWRLGTAITGR